MTATYDDYKNTSTLSWSKDGITVDRTLYLRAATEIDCRVLADCPQRNDALATSGGSDALNIYCSDVTISSVSDAAAKDGLFLWEVKAKYEPLSASNPTVNKAKWSVGFRPQQINVRGVNQESLQAHYGLSGSDASEYPPVTTAINVTEEGPQGVDIDEMVEVLTIDFWKAPDDAGTFLTAVRTIKNCVNVSALTGPWGTYAAGECRITGVTVSETKGEVATISVEISISRNEADVTVFLDSIDAEVIFPKGGWEYLWIRFIKANKQDDVDVRPLAIDVHVATLYASGDYSVLGITGDIWQ